MLVLSLLISAGCIRQPNSNLSYSSCCEQRADEYTCHVQLDGSGKPQMDSGGHIILIGCGNECKSMTAEGVLLDASGNLLKHSGDGTPYVPTDCQEAGQNTNCNFRRADCSNGDGAGRCYQLNSDGTRTQDKNSDPPQDIVVAPVCAPAVANPCVQNDCKALVCGKPGAGGLGSFDKKTLDSAASADGNSELAAQARANTQTGLVDKICEYRKLDAATSRVLATGKWTMDSLRLGVGGSFSDYDRARFYLPPSDFYCDPTNPQAVVDRFTNYLSGTSALGEFLGAPVNQKAECTGPTNDGNQKYYSCNNDGRDYYDPGGLAACQRACKDKLVPGTPDYKAPLTLCKFDDGTRATPPVNPFYYCATSPANHYSISSSDGGTSAYLTCNQACAFSVRRTCEQNPKLLTRSLAVNPPDQPEFDQSFVNIDAYYDTLKSAYPSSDSADAKRDARNYYRPALPRPDSGDPDYAAKMQDYQANLAKPGPAGAKVFECAKDSDCLSGTCDTSGYSRNSCYLQDGTSVDCGCKTVDRCDLAFMCEQYPKTKDGRGMARANCEASRDLCQQANGGKDGPATVCSYRPADPNVLNARIYLNYPDPALIMDYAAHAAFGAGSWGFLDFEEFNRFFGANGGNASGVEMVNQMINDPARSTAGWRDDLDLQIALNKWLAAYRHYEQDSINNFVRQNWPRSWQNAPDWQTVFGPGGKRFIITSRLVTWQNNDCDLSLSGYDAVGNPCPPDKIKFPLISACKMTVGALPPEDSAAATPVLRASSDSDASIRYLSLDFPPSDKTVTGAHTGWDGLLQRYDRTWEIKGFGKCQVNATGQLFTKTYGVCQPCGSVLTLAYQKVDGWAYAASTQILLFSSGGQVADIKAGDTLGSGAQAIRVAKILSFAPGAPNRLLFANADGMYYVAQDTDAGDYGVFTTSNRAAYCPTGCLGGYSIFGERRCTRCPNDYPNGSFSHYSQGGPASDPEYGFLVNKIDEYQSTGVRPVLDLKEYPLATPQVRHLEGFTRDGCENAGGALGDSYCVLQDSDGTCSDNRWYCDFPAVNDWLLAFLYKNHSAAVLIADTLPSDCSANGISDGPACLKARERLKTVATGCPDCQRALEFPGPMTGSRISLNPSTIEPVPASDVLGQWSDGYPDALNHAIGNWSGNPDGAYSIQRMTAPGSWSNAVPDAVQKVNVLVVDVNLSTVDPASSDFDAQINRTVNLSRHVLQQAGWPTIWKLSFDPQSTSGAGAYNQDALYKKLFSRERELTESGVSGILLPGLDYGTAGVDARLLPTNDANNYKTAGTPLCAAEEGSKNYLTPQVTGAVHRVDAQPSCTCVLCSDAEKKLGLCGGNTGSDLCLDDKSCTLSQDQTGRGYTQADVKCPTMCIRNDFCQANVCNAAPEAAKTTTCTALTSTTSAPRVCDGTNVWPNCEIQKVTLSQLGDPILKPDAPSLIAGLPDNGLCCLKNGTGYYTYRGVVKIDVKAEPTMFPAFGSNLTECGRLPQVSGDANSCSATSLLPVYKRAYSCTSPQ